MALDACSGGVIVFDEAGAVAYASPTARSYLRDLGAPAAARRDILRPLLETKGAKVIPLRGATGSICGEVIPIPGEDRATLADRERRAIVETLEATRWRLSETARRLGISRTTLWRRVRAYGLAREASPRR